MNRVEKLREFARLRGLKSELEAQVKSVNADIEAITSELTREMLDDGMTSVKVEGVGLFSVVQELYPSVKDKDTFIKHIYETGQESLITVNFQTMKSINNLHNEEFGRDLPGVESFKKLSIRMRKS
jgi:hypothetical protein